jgi:Cu+-exporting ATPase
VLDACAEQGCTCPVSDSQSLTGRGIAGRWKAATWRWATAACSTKAAAARRAGQCQAWEAEGRTLSWLIERGSQPRVLGLFAFGDSLKPGAAQAIDALHARTSAATC